MSPNSVEVDLSRDLAAQVMGEAQVQFFDEHGYLEVLARNGYTYFIFGPVPSRHLGALYAPLAELSWCVFGVDPRSDSDPLFPYPREHFFSYHSRRFVHYDDLLGVWFDLKDDPVPFLLLGCDPLARIAKAKRPATSRMLRKIGRTLGPKDYSAAWWRSRASELPPEAVRALCSQERSAAS